MANNTVKLSVYGIPPVELEAHAGADITPGMLLERSAADTVIPHANAILETSPKLVAVENPAYVKAPSLKAINTVYATGELVHIISARPGDYMWMWLDIGQLAVVGSPLVSFGNGHLAVGDAPPYTSGAIAAVSLEAIDTTPGGSVPVRIKVEIA